MTSSRQIIPPPERAGLTRAEAAAYISVSPPTFDSLVRAKLMPRPRKVGTRLIWIRWEVHAALVDLPFADELDDVPSGSKDDGWGLAQPTVRVKDEWD